ncbi:hypothetical protein TIFTF001_028621 [Ficus carica]|uniref:Uncharacterized protein n=1 Tax=Ficus carica TaxID=3494 RepID=A0AA88J1D7_FICCA|nr:hypothetical protein TIFTF001_028621 [Ficus carica]
MGPMVDIADVDNMATTATMTENNAAPPNSAVISFFLSGSSADWLLAGYGLHAIQFAPLNAITLFNDDVTRLSPYGQQFDLVDHSRLDSFHPEHLNQSLNPCLTDFHNPLRHVLPQPLLGTPPTEAFNMQQAIANVVSKQVNTMERRMPQALGHPATYEDLLDEMDLSPFAQAIIVTTMPAKLLQI